MTRKWYATLRHPKMYPHTKFGIPTSKNIGDMDRTRKRDGRTDGRTDGLTDGRTVRLLYASQSSFGGIKKIISYSNPKIKILTSNKPMENAILNISKKYFNGGINNKSMEATILNISKQNIFNAILLINNNANKVKMYKSIT